MEYAVPGSTFYNFFPATFHSFEPKNIPQKYYNIYTLFNSISIGTSQTTKNDENITQPYDSTFIADRFKYSIRREIRVVSGSKDNILYKKFWLQYLQVYICSPLPVNVSQRIKALPLLCRWYRTLKVAPFVRSLIEVESRLLTNDCALLIDISVPIQLHTPSTVKTTVGNPWR